MKNSKNVLPILSLSNEYFEYYFEEILKDLENKNKEAQNEEEKKKEIFIFKDNKMVENISN